MHRHRVRFFQIIGGLAKIEGSAATDAKALRLELAMTESPEGPLKGVLKRSIPYSALDDVQLSRRILRAPSLRFIANSLEAFQAIPGATGYEYVVTPHGSKAEIRAFVSDLQLAIAESTMDQFSRQIEDSVDEQQSGRE